jgi:hypothetical protein
MPLAGYDRPIGSQVNVAVQTNVNLDLALPQNCQRDVPRSYFCSGSGDAVGRHLTQTFNFAVCSHRVPALDCARDIAKLNLIGIGGNTGYLLSRRVSR